MDIYAKLAGWVKRSIPIKQPQHAAACPPDWKPSARRYAWVILAALSLAPNAQAAANQPPTVTLSAPLEGAIYQIDDSIGLSAQASDPDGQIAKVDFYRNGALIGSAAAPPYTAQWIADKAGSHTLTAKATDNQGKAATSTALHIVVNAPPTVSFTAPRNNALFVAPAAITLTANAKDSDGQITKVEFYNGAILLGSAAAAPYTFIWNNIPPGAYTLTAQATDGRGAVAISRALDIRVDDPPKVALTAPAEGSLYTAPAAITLGATASDSDGQIVRVDFYRDDKRIASATATPYTVTWNKAPAGSYTLTARALDDRGKTTVSAPVRITVDAPPKISLSAPKRNAVYFAPAAIPLAVKISDKDGQVVKVDYYADATLIGSATSAPFDFAWNNVPPGSYSLTALATDDKGVATTSKALPIRVDAPPLVAITAPADNAYIDGPANITLSAQATDPDGKIKRVEFYQNGVLIGSDTRNPYSTVWKKAPLGTYTLTARAIDNDNQGSDSPPVAIMVRSAVNTPPAASLTAPADGAVIQAGDSVTLAADTSDADGLITKVEFYQGNVLIGSAIEAPYAITWDNAPAGAYAITAKATDDRNGATTSTPIQLIVNAPPTASLTAPTDGTVLYAPADITLSAVAADSDGNVVKVAFYQGNTLIGVANQAPYGFTWNNVPAGSYNLSALAYDDKGGQAASSPVFVIVDALPSVKLSATPVGGLLAPATVSLTAQAADGDGSIARVDFYQGAALIGSSNQPPYTFTWNDIQPGDYSFTAQATDDRGGQSASAPVALTVAANQPPQVSLTSPTAGQSYAAPATVNLVAQASDADGKIVKIEFYQGDTLLGSATQAPFAYVWNNVAAGNYNLTAQATDDKGAVTTSAPIAISVTAGQSHGIFYIHADHLGTPRVVTDEADKIVWQYDLLSEPFGNSDPDEDPDGDGRKFEFNLRFPGQYYDKETRLNYNYFRDYDPATGRYIQADPIGVAGGINLYGYVKGDPVSKLDFLGLVTTVVTTFDYGLGSHSAIHVNTPGQEPYLYDPAGSYNPGNRRGGDGIFEGGDANLNNYVKFQESTGSTVKKVTLLTTPEQEAAIKANADQIGDPRGFSCASSVSAALGGACGIGQTIFPGSLYDKAKGASCGKK